MYNIIVYSVSIVKADEVLKFRYLLKYVMIS